MCLHQQAAAGSTISCTKINVIPIYIPMYQHFASVMLRRLDEYMTDGFPCYFVIWHTGRRDANVFAGGPFPKLNMLLHCPLKIVDLAHVKGCINMLYHINPC